MNSYEWVESLRVINCLEKEDFIECFGPSGVYLWNKFMVEKKADIFDFLSYLDLSNGEKLYTFCLNKIRTREVKKG